MSEKLKAKQKPHYVDNKKFLVAMTEWRLKYDKAEKAKRKQPIVTNLSLIHISEPTRPY